MNYKIISFVAIFIFFIASCKPLEKSGKSTLSNPKELLVVSYNVENLFDTKDDPSNPGDNEFTPESEKNWTQERYDKKISDLAKVISSIDIELPDIVGLCEVENRQVIEDLISDTSLSAGNYGIVHEQSPDPRGIDVALIYKKSEFEYVSHEAIKVKLPDNAKYRTRDILHVMGVVLEKDTFHIFVNHWKSRSGGVAETEHKRINAAKILRAEVDKILDKNPAANIIIMGDLNDEPQNTSVSKTLNATNNRSAKDYKELYNVLYNKDLNNEGSYSYKGNWNMIDNIIISQNLLGNRLGFHVAKNDGEVFMPKWILYYQTKADKYVPNKTYGGKNYYGGISDHLPVYIIFSL